jgi:hypothetical protein
VSKEQVGLHLNATNTSTWGGTPVRGRDGKVFHLFAEYMVHHCPLTNWYDSLSDDASYKNIVDIYI